MCSYFIVEYKSFVSLKNESLLFWMRVHVRGGSQILQNFEGGCSKREGLTDLEFFFFFGGGGGLGKKG